MVPALLRAQTPQLSLTQVAAPSGHAAFSLTVSDDSPVDIAALQWSLQYAPNTITDASVVEQDSALSGNKQISCTTGSGGLVCVLAGLNASPIPNGRVALVTLTLNTGAQTEITFVSALAASPDGGSVAVKIPTNAITLGEMARQQQPAPNVQHSVPATAPPPQTADSSANASSLTSAPSKGVEPGVAVPLPSGAFKSTRIPFTRGATTPPAPIFAPMFMPSMTFAESPVIGSFEPAMQFSPARESSNNEGATVDQSPHEKVSESSCDSDSEAATFNCKTKECRDRRSRPCRAAQESSKATPPPAPAPMKAAKRRDSAAPISAPPAEHRE